MQNSPTRESEQPIQSTCGDWPFALRANRAGLAVDMRVAQASLRARISCTKSFVGSAVASSGRLGRPSSEEASEEWDSWSSSAGMVGLVLVGAEEGLWQEKRRYDRGDREDSREEERRAGGDSSGGSGRKLERRSILERPRGRSSSGR